MTKEELILRTRRYIRDVKSTRFEDEDIQDYINEGVDRLRSNIYLTNLPYVVGEVLVLPQQYHYILSLYAASRCFGIDHDFYQEEQKRNEFENMFLELVIKIENGEVDLDNDYTYPIDFVTDVYFGNTTSNEEELTI